MKVQDCREEGREKTEEGGKKKRPSLTSEILIAHMHTHSRNLFIKEERRQKNLRKREKQVVTI